MAKKYYPVTRYGKLDTPASTSGEIILSIDRFLAKTNRRLYRQARCYSVKISIDQDSTEKFAVYALANNWMNHRALKMAYEMYLENSSDERARLKGTAQARWQDFRVLSGSAATGANPVQFDVNQVPVQLTAGDYDSTIVVDAANVSRTFTWGTPGLTEYGILQEYDKAGNANSSPTTSTGDMPYDNLMSDDDPAMAVALQTRGDTPPYDANGVGAASPWVKIAQLGAGTAQQLSTGFFEAPCGFVLIVPVGGTEDNLDDLSWEVQSGDYKGVKAPSWLE
jgi:hypothetical protein